MNAKPSSWAIGFLLAVLVLAVCVRVFPAWDHVVQPDGSVQLLGVDSYYHLRHVERVVDSFPMLDRMENADSFPEMNRSEAIGSFQLILGGITRLLGGSAETARWVCAWSGPMQAVLIGLLFAWLSVQVWGWRVAFVLSALLLVFPGPSFDRTVFGFCDHHGLEIFFNVALVIVWANASRAEAAWRDLKSWWRPAIGGGLVVSAYMFTWKGAPVFLFVSLLAVAVSTLWILASGKSARGLLLGTCRVMLVAFAMTALVGLLFPVLRILPDLHNAGLVLMLVAAAVCAATGAILRRLAGRLSGVAQAMLIAFLGAGVWMAALHLMPGLSRIGELVFSRKTTAIQEHQAIAWKVVWSNFGPLFFLAIAGTLVAIWRSRTLPISAFIAIASAWAAIAMWARTGDYSYNAPAFVVLLTGAFWKEAWITCRKLGDRLPRWRRSLSFAIPVVAVGLLASTVYPMGRVAGPLRAPEFYRSFALHSPAWAETVAWLRTAPKTDDGVWCHWPYGGLVAAESGWPAINSRYPRGHLLAPMFTPGEEQAIALPTNGKVPFSETARYAVVNASIAANDLLTEIGHMGLDASTIFDPISVSTPDGQAETLLRYNRYYTGTLLGRMYTLNGSGLRRFRAVHESADQSYLRYHVRGDGKMGVMADPAPSDGPELDALLKRVKSNALPWDEAGGRSYAALLMPTVKTFEQVSGSKIRYLDAAAVEAQVSLTLVAENTGRRFEYVQQAYPESDGVLTFRLPYSQNPPPHISIRPDGPYRLTVTMKDQSTVQTEIRLAEEAVIDGRTMDLDARSKP